MSAFAAMAIFWTIAAVQALCGFLLILSAVLRVGWADQRNNFRDTREALRTILGSFTLLVAGMIIGGFAA